MARRLGRRGFLAASVATSAGFAGCLHAETGDTELDEADDEPEEDLRVGARREMLKNAERPGDSENWLTWGYDNQNTGYNPHTTGPKDDVKRVWTYEADDSIHSQPAVVDDTVYFGSDDGRIHAVDADTGEKKFSYSTEGVVNTTPTIAGAQLLTGDRDHPQQPEEEGGRFYALDLRTVEEEWRIEDLGSIQKSPVFHGHHAITATGNALRAIDLATRQHTVDIYDHGASTVPAIHRESLITAVGLPLRIINLQTYEEEWSWPQKARFHVRSPPAIDVSRNRIYLGGAIKSLHSISIEDQEEFWDYAPEERNLTIESRQIPPTNTVSPCVHPEVVVTAENPVSWATPGAYGVDHEGEELWRNEEAGYHRTSPAATEDTVYTTDIDATVNAINIHSGDTRWSHQLDGETPTSPAVTNGRVYVADETGTMYALE